MNLRALLLVAGSFFEIYCYFSHEKSLLEMIFQAFVCFLECGKLLIDEKIRSFIILKDIS